MTDGLHIPREELALHAMQALTREESALIRAHLEQCALCREELTLVSGDLALVAMSVEEQTLPDGARQRFMDRVAASAAPRGMAPKPEFEIAPVVAERRSNGWSVWMPWLAAAALLVVAVGLELKVRTLDQLLWEHAQLEQAQAAQNARAQKVLELLTTSRAQHVTLTAAPTRPAPSARAVYLAAQGSLILQASNLAPVPSGKTYELWIIPANGTAPVPAGLFRPDAAGSASLVMPQLPQGVQAKAFGVTVEDEAGAQKPTLPIVLSGAATGE